MNFIKVVSSVFLKKGVEYLPGFRRTNILVIFHCAGKYCKFNTTLLVIDIIFQLNQIQTSYNFKPITHTFGRKMIKVTPKIIAEEINSNLNSRKAIKFYLLTGMVLKQLDKD